MRTVVVPTRAAEGPTAPASSYDVGQKVKAAAWAGGFVALGLAVGTAVLLLPMGEWRAWLWALAVSLVAGILATCWLGCRWVISAASRPWMVDDQIRYRVWDQEDAERKAAEAAAEAAKKDITEGDLDHDKDPSTLNTAQRLHLVAIEVLRRHGVGNLPTTREAMVAEGVCSQAEWNRVNELMQKVGLKRGYKLRKDLSFAEAWQAWSDSVKFAPGYVWPP